MAISKFSPVAFYVHHPLHNTYAPRSAFLLKANGAFLERKKQTPYIRSTYHECTDMPTYFFPHIFGVKAATFCACPGLGNDVRLLYSITTQQDTSTWENGSFVTHKEVTLRLH